MEGRRRKRVLSEEEAALWAHVTRHDTPLLRPRAEPEAIAAAMSEPALTAEAKKTATTPPVTPPPVASYPKPAKNGQAAPPLPAPFDHREAKRLARGRREIDARLDLHGFRQQDAHAALRRFLTHAQAQGYRHVLIITGKGRADPAAGQDFWTSEERGVLRRLVPHWLCEPSLRPYVVSFSESALHHGGSGAMYVTIRKSRNGKSER
jgi:DNA-nicking Smr family endonuclease